MPSPCKSPASVSAVGSASTASSQIFTGCVCYIEQTFSQTRAGCHLIEQLEVSGATIRPHPTPASIIFVHESLEQPLNLVVLISPQCNTLNESPNERLIGRYGSLLGADTGHAADRQSVVVRSQWAGDCLAAGRILGREGGYGGWEVRGTYDAKLTIRPKRKLEPLSYEAARSIGQSSEQTSAKPRKRIIRGRDWPTRRPSEAGPSPLALYEPSTSANTPSANLSHLVPMLGGAQNETWPQNALGLTYVSASIGPSVSENTGFSAKDTSCITLSPCTPAMTMSSCTTEANLDAIRTPMSPYPTLPAIPSKRFPARTPLSVLEGDFVAFEDSDPEDSSNPWTIAKERGSRTPAPVWLSRPKPTKRKHADVEVGDVPEDEDERRPLKRARAE